MASTNSSQSLALKLVRYLVLACITLHLLLAAYVAMVSGTEIFNAVDHILADAFAIPVIIYFAFAARYQPEKFKGLVVIFLNAMLAVRFCFLLVASSIYAARARSLVYTFEDLDGNVSSAD